MKVQSNQAQVAKLCRQYLKSQGIKCSVTSKGYSGGDSVNVTVYDQCPEVMKSIESQFHQYEYGHFDGMTDCYEYSNTNGNIPQTKFLFIHNSISDALEQTAWTWMQKHLAGADEFPSVYKEVPSNAQVFGFWASSTMGRLLNGSMDTCSTDFWATT